jgi:hypothetical protein
MRPSMPQKNHPLNAVDEQGGKIQRRALFKVGFWAQKWENLPNIKGRVRFIPNPLSVVGTKTAPRHYP